MQRGGLPVGYAEEGIHSQFISFRSYALGGLYDLYGLLGFVVFVGFVLK